MRRSLVCRGYVLTEMLVQTKLGDCVGLTLVDTGGQTLVTPEAAKALSKDSPGGNPSIAAYALPVDKIKSVVNEYERTHKPLTKENFFN